MPQEGALFPHLDVAGNVGFGLPRAERRRGGRRVAEVLELVGLAQSYATRYPHELSGGQQQRVALARALASEPTLVLLDEPFSSLDASLREETGRAVARALHASGSTGVLVTHDRSEAMSLADQLAVMADGRFLQVGPPEEVYLAPANLQVASFVTDAVLVEARVVDGRAQTPLGTLCVEHPGPGDHPRDLPARAGDPAGAAGAHPRPPARVEPDGRRAGGRVPRPARDRAGRARRQRPRDRHPRADGGRTAPGRHGHGRGGRRRPGVPPGAAAMTLTPTLRGPRARRTSPVPRRAAARGARGPGADLGGPHLDVRRARRARSRHAGQLLGATRRLVMLECANDLDTVATYLAAFAGRPPGAAARRPVTSSATPDWSSATTPTWSPRRQPAWSNGDRAPSTPCTPTSRCCSPPAAPPGRRSSSGSRGTTWSPTPTASGPTWA